MIEIKCEVCKKKFLTKNHLRGIRKTCSRKCGGKNWTKKMTGHKPFHYKGGRLVRKGYIYLLAKKHPNNDRDGYVLEHRLVVEKSLNRFLKKNEIIHHINGIKDDNRIENLELLSASEHAKRHHPKGTHIWKGKHPRGNLKPLFIRTS